VVRCVYAVVIAALGGGYQGCGLPGVGSHWPHKAQTVSAAFAWQLGSVQALSSGMSVRTMQGSMVAPEVPQNTAFQYRLERLASFSLSCASWQSLRQPHVTAGSPRVVCATHLLVELVMFAPEAACQAVQLIHQAITLLDGHCPGAVGLWHACIRQAGEQLCKPSADSQAYVA
jgi:hypothetical protein